MQCNQKNKVQYNLRFHMQKVELHDSCKIMKIAKVELI